jgi:hypothetical protein
MSSLPGDLRAKHKRPRWARDFYVEPEWASEKLFAELPFADPVHDPACGTGRIVEAARRAGYQASGSDIAEGGYGETGIDFFADQRPRTTLAFNAPYKENEAFIGHGLAVASFAVAVFVRINFLCGQGRFRRLFGPHPPAMILPLSRRASCPPGGTGIPAKNGTDDYTWILWLVGYQGPTVVHWLPP